MRRCREFPDFEIFQYVFSQNKGARQACLAPIACVASTAPHDDHSCNIRVNYFSSVTMEKTNEKRHVADAFPVMKVESAVDPLYNPQNGGIFVQSFRDGTCMLPITGKGGENE